MRVEVARDIKMHEGDEGKLRLKLEVYTDAVGHSFLSRLPEQVVRKVLNSTLEQLEEEANNFVPQL